MGDGEETTALERYLAPPPLKENPQATGRREPQDRPVQQLQRGGLGRRRHDLPDAERRGVQTP